MVQGGWWNIVSQICCLLNQCLKASISRNVIKLDRALLHNLQCPRKGGDKLQKINQKWIDRIVFTLITNFEMCKLKSRNKVASQRELINSLDVNLFLLFSFEVLAPILMK